jgi:predicted O-linked N-acetylglucosamine transferase (SPINDLY family)
LIAYSTSTFSDALTERLKACCGEWNSTVGLSDKKLAERIFADQIDILIDLAGHTGYNRLPLFAWKPAPVQATWLGYLATTGVRAIDYIIGDPWVLPFAEQVYFTEKICHIPDSYVCFTPPEIDVPVSDLPAQNNGYITFGCFNNLSKVNDSVIALWSRILTAVPNSRLYLKTKQLSDPVVKVQVTAQFESHGIKPGRLILEGTKPNRTEHLASYGRVDIALDPFPYPGITTSVEALWMGVPMITLAAQGFLSRQGIGILTNAGLPDWISTDENDYVLKAIHHASDLTRLTALRARLRQQVMKSPLFDAPRFAQNFESTLRGMWTEWSKLQLSKESFSLH